MPNTPQNNFKNRDVRGPGPYSIGHIARPTGGYNAAHFLIEKRKREEWNRKNEETHKDILMQTVKNKFEEITDRKCIRSTIKNMVDAGMKAASLDLDNRRERLRKLLEEEELRYKKEAYEQAAHAQLEAYAVKKCRAQDLRIQREHERMKVVEEKRLQQFMNNYEPVRNMIIKKNHEQTFCAQLDQLKEIEERRKNELEVKAFWDQVDMKSLEKQKEKAEADAQEAKRKIVEAQTMLLKQQEEKQTQKAEEAAVKAEELRELEKIKEQARLEEMNSIKEKRAKRETFQSLLKEQIAEHESVIARQIECDKLIDHQIAQVANEELLRQKEQRKNFMEEAQREIQFYAQHMEELKQERSKEDKRFEELVETQRKYQEQLRDEQERLKKAAQNELKKEVLAQRKMQLQMNEKKNADEKEMQVLEAQLAEKLRLDTLRSEREEAQKISAAKAKYAIELKQQMELMQQIKEREKEEADRLLQREIMAEKDYLGKAKELINNKVDKGIHPFRAILTDKEARTDCKNDFEYLNKCKNFK